MMFKKIVDRIGLIALETLLESKFGIRILSKLFWVVVLVLFNHDFGHS